MLSSDKVLHYSWVCLFRPIRGMHLHTLVSGASPTSWRVNTSVVVYVIRLSPDFLWQSKASAMAGLLLLFVGFYCCREEAIVIERALAALPETDRWEPGLQMVRVSLGGRETTWGSKTQGCLDDSSPLFCPHLACLPASAPCLLPRLSVSCPVILTWSIAQAFAGLPGLGSLCSHGRRAVRLSVFCWADEESAGAHCRDEGVHFFHRSALDCLFFPAQAIKGWWLKPFHWNKISLNFPSLFNTSFLRFGTWTFEGNFFFP